MLSRGKPLKKQAAVNVFRQGLVALICVDPKENQLARENGTRSVVENYRGIYRMEESRKRSL